MKIDPHQMAPRSALWFALLIGSLVVSGRLVAQQQELENPKLEQGQVGDAPPGWRFSSQGAAVCTVVAEAPFEGERAALIDASALSGRAMSNIIQSLDATPWRGKRVRYRAAVKTAELAPDIGAQMWFRVDRPENGDGNRQSGAFDNMRDRPITGGAWQHYDIVLDVEQDASKVVLGLFLLGKGKAWIDDVSVEVVDKSVETTGGASSRSDRSGSGFQMPAAVRKALQEAQNAPQQSFWTWWLILPVIATALFFVGLWPVRPGVESTESAGEAARSELGWPRAFALRFTICYWLLYCLPGPFTTIIRDVGSLMATVGRRMKMGTLMDWAEGVRWFGGRVSGVHGDFESWMSHLSAAWLFGIEGELVPPNGSGDTTMGYLTILNYFALAFVLAVLWTLLLRRRPSRNASVDMLRTYLRYVLAFAMLGYGLAKVNMAGNQFPEVNDFRLGRTWGETSPMGLVWGFMGASQAYTIFAGLGEIVAAAFLIWRHTALLGAVIGVAVMTNVVMLNYCYDVPVKIYSTHLVLMGVLIMVPDARRLLGLLVLNRGSTDPGTPTSGRRSGCPGYAGCPRPSSWACASSIRWGRGLGPGHLRTARGLGA